MNMHQGMAVGAPNADKLAKRGEFEMDGIRYKAFYAEGVCRSVLARTPPLLTNGYGRRSPEDERANVHKEGRIGADN
jgi:hypothetical protein